MSDYETLVAQIRIAPVTQLPALLRMIVERCIRENVFSDGGMELFIRNVKTRVLGATR